MDRPCMQKGRKCVTARMLTTHAVCPISACRTSSCADKWQAQKTRSIIRRMFRTRGAQTACSGEAPQCPHVTTLPLVTFCFLLCMSRRTHEDALVQYLVLLKPCSHGLERGRLHAERALTKRAKLPLHHDGTSSSPIQMLHLLILWALLRSGTC